MSQIPSATAGAVSSAVLTIRRAAEQVPTRTRLTDTAPVRRQTPTAGAVPARSSPPAAPVASADRLNARRARRDAVVTGAPARGGVEFRRPGRGRSTGIPTGGRGRWPRISSICGRFAGFNKAGSRSTGDIEVAASGAVVTHNISALKYSVRISRSTLASLEAEFGGGGANARQARQNDRCDVHSD